MRPHLLVKTCMLNNRHSQSMSTIIILFTLLLCTQTVLFIPAEAAPRSKMDAAVSTTDEPNVHLQLLNIPTVLTHGVPFTIAARWSNDGTPLDSRWEVVYQLHNSDMSVAIELVSETDLSDLLLADAPSVSDEFWISSNVKPGSYTISVLVRDPGAKRSPLTLTMTNLQGDGSYALGTTNVQAALSLPPIEYTLYLPLNMATRDSTDARASSLVILSVFGVENNSVLRGQAYIGVETDGSVSSVEFRLNGSKTLTWTENNAPWWFMGNDGSDRQGWDTTKFPDGRYNLTITLIGQDSRTTSTERTFTVDNQSSSTGTVVTFRPRQLTMSAPEIINPMRGLYRWMSQEYAPQPIPARDSYERYTWRDLEPTQGNYRFAALEADIIQAAREGRKFSFRVRTVVATKGSAIPEYAMGGKGWWADYNDDGDRDTYVPDWNSETFLDRLDIFMQALGNHYNGDPRIGFIDIGLYGNWGEWHMANFSYPSPSGAQRITTANKYRLVDMHTNAFPNTPLIMMTDDTEALVYAMKRSPRIGWRRDSLGWDTGHFGKIERDSVRWNAIKDRWKTALVVTEFCNPRYQDDPQVYQQALDEVRRYHVSLVSNANTLKWSSLSTAGKEAFTLLGKTAGYRLILNELSLPTMLSSGDSFSIQTRWSNIGVAPVYEPWQVHMQLRKLNSNEIVWGTVSAINLDKVLPDNPTNQNDTVTLPSNMAKGQYDVVVVVKDPRGTRTPLALALTNAQADGSYRLGTVTVR